MRSVGRASVSSQVFKHTREFTLEKSRTDVTSVGKASVSVPAFKTIRKSTPKESSRAGVVAHACEPSVEEAEAGR